MVSIRVLQHLLIKQKLDILGGAFGAKQVLTEVVTLVGEDKLF